MVDGTLYDIGPIDGAKNFAEVVARRDPNLIQHNILEQIYGLGDYLDRCGRGRVIRRKSR